MFTRLEIIDQADETIKEVSTAALVILGMILILSHPLNASFNSRLSRRSRKSNVKKMIFPVCKELSRFK